MNSLSLKSIIMIILSCKAWLPDSSKSASDIVGAVHISWSANTF